MQHSSTDLPRTHSLVVVANRLPIQHHGDDWQASPGGLVRAMLGVLRARAGAWVGWTGDIAAEPGPDQPRVAFETMPTPDDLAGAELVSVPMTAEEFTHHYERVSNGALWPLFHDAIRESTYDAESWAVFRSVNERFADAAAATSAPGATVWIHDYQLLLVPAALRARRPDLRIGFFLHIPFPPQELFMRMPWREEILRGLLGADVIGFQRPVGAENFVHLTKRLLGLDAEGASIRVDESRTVHVGTFPISIDVAEIEALATAPGIGERVAEIRQRLGNPETIFLGVDRLDYTKGIDLRLASFQALLRAHPPADVTAPASTVLVQVAVPGREGVDSYMEERHNVEQIVGDINGEHATIGYPVVHYLRRSLTLEDLVPLYMAADVMLVTPRRDGMNLVAKEFVASRLDQRGMLILSEFAGAADELTDAILVNPHDPDAILAAMNTALTTSVDEASARMAQMRKIVTEHDVHEWTRTFLRALDDAVDASARPPSAGGDGHNEDR